MTSEMAVPIGTGAIGTAIARRAAAGRTLLAKRNEQQLNDLAELLKNEGYNTVTQTVDVSDEEAVRALARQAASLGKVMRVVHVAGVSPN